MGHEIVYCGRCRKQLRGPDFEKGGAFHAGAAVFCGKCIRQAVPEFKPEAQKRTSTARLPSVKAHPTESSGRLPRIPSTTRRLSPPPGPKAFPAALAVGGLAVFLAAVVGIAAMSSGRTPSPAPESVRRARPAGEEALKEARAYAAAHPGDFAEQAARFEKAMAEAAGTPAAGEAARERHQALDRLEELRRAMEEVENLIWSACGKDDFKGALAMADRAKERAPARRWAAWSEAKRKEIESQREGAFESAKSAAVRERGLGYEADVEKIRARVRAWGVARYDAALEAALEATAPPPPGPGK